MSEHQSDHTDDPTLKGPGEGDPSDHHKGSLEPAPVTETTDESGTGSADKRSKESLAEQDDPPGGSSQQGGAAAGDITR